MPVDPKKPVDPNDPKGPQIDIGDLELEDVPADDLPANEGDQDDVKWKRKPGGCGGPETDD